MPIQTITSKELEELIAYDRSLSLIDIREDFELTQGKIKEAKHIRMNDIPVRKEELAKDERHFIICRSGNRSARACEYLQSFGYDVVNVEGGMLDWEGDIELSGVKK